MNLYSSNIAARKLSIYDFIDPNDSDLYISTEDLQKIIGDSLIGLSLDGYALRTRSKIVKSEICKALGYPIPKSFIKTQPRFPGQNFDVYTQKSLNVQIWNEDIDISRRYVFLQINENDVITAVRVITGAELIQYDTTGTLTQKYQATMNSYGRNICSKEDSENVREWIIDSDENALFGVNPNDLPSRTQLLRIKEIYKRLLPMVGNTISYINAVQERNRGAELHEMICSHLGYSIFEDDGTYPDITNQLLEVKLQTSPTIDLGQHSPEDGDCIFEIDNNYFYSDDIRYAIFDGKVCGDRILLRNLYLVSGEDFTNHFPLFKEGGINAKLQLPLPQDFFN